MKSKAVVVALVAFAIGFLTHLAISRVRPLWSDQSADVAKHWKCVRDYRAQLRNPRNHKLDSQNGLNFVQDTVDPSPSLAALVSAGELVHVDVVFPMVPKSREVNRYWMEFVEQHEEIVEANANPEYADYRPSGEAPLHLNLWFKPTAKGDVQQLIKALEDFATTNR